MVGVVFDSVHAVYTQSSNASSSFAIQGSSWRPVSLHSPPITAATMGETMNQAIFHTGGHEMGQATKQITYQTTG